MVRRGRLNMRGVIKSGSPINLYGGSNIGASTKEEAYRMRDNIAEKENLIKSAIIVKKKKKGYYLYWR